MKIVVVFSDRDEAEQVAEAFSAQGCTIAAIGTLGTEALSLCKDLCPDCLVTEPFLPYLNCDDIAGLLAQKCALPPVQLVLSPEKNDAMAQRFMTLGGDLYLRTPFDPGYTVRRLEHLLDQRREKEFFLPQAQSLAYVALGFLQKMEMPTALQGYQYIQDAIAMADLEATRLKQMVLELYPAIADLHQTTPMAVERCIRNAITQTFARGNNPFLQEHFAHAVKPGTGRPTNSEFLSILLRLVKTELK